jgi:hypothetical protein
MACIRCAVAAVASIICNRALQTFAKSAFYRKGMPGGPEFRLGDAEICVRLQRNFQARFSR